MIKKFDTYWHDMSGILSVVCIFDPRFKLRSVGYYFSMIYRDDATSHVQIVHNDCQSKVKKYKTRYASVATSPRYSSSSLSTAHSAPSSGSYRSSTKWISGFTSFVNVDNE